MSKKLNLAQSALIASIVSLSNMASGLCNDLNSTVNNQTGYDTRRQIETVEVTGIGSTPDQARADAARAAVQQVAGALIDSTRRIELKLTDNKLSETIQEKIISYSGAFVEKLEIISAKKTSDLYEVQCRVSVVKDALTKQLSAEKIPTVSFDSNSATSKVETLQEKGRSSQEVLNSLYDGARKLLKFEVKGASISDALPMTDDNAWLDVKFQWIANSDAIKEWKEKFSFIADDRANIQIATNRVEPQDRNKQCILRNADTIGTSESKFWRKYALNNNEISRDTASVAVCFATSVSDQGVPSQCFGKYFTWEDARVSARTCDASNNCPKLERMRGLGIGWAIQFLDRAGNEIHRVPGNFENFPAIKLFRSHSRPNGRDDKGFFDYCQTTQAPFFSMMQTFGLGRQEILFMPPSDAKLEGVFHVLLPTEIINKTAAIKAMITDENGL